MDLNPADKYFEIFAAEFFGNQLSVFEVENVGGKVCYTLDIFSLLNFSLPDSYSMHTIIPLLPSPSYFLIYIVLFSPGCHA